MKRNQPMRIDLRYLIPIVAFYIPGLLMTTGALMLGYSIAEVRHVIASLGGLLGAIGVLVAWVNMDLSQPIWITLWKKKEPTE